MTLNEPPAPWWDHLFTAALMLAFILGAIGLVF